MSKPELAHLFAKCELLLLDFDGPVCSVFAGYSAALVASELCAKLYESTGDRPKAVTGTTDPLEVLRWTGLNRPGLVPKIEDALRTAELIAVTGAAPTPYSSEVLIAAKHVRLSTAIVSNNSAPAIEAYITAHGLNGYISLIVGREPYRPDRMKPDPRSVETAVRRFKAKPQETLLVGDSIADIIASQSAGVRAIGFANKPDKLAQFKAASVDTVITSMAVVASAIDEATRQH